MEENLEEIEELILEFDVARISFAEEEEEEEEEARIVVSLKDITERKRMEEEKLKAQQIAMAEQVLMIMEQEKRVIAEKGVGELKGKLKRKTQKVKEAYQLQERFIADASHELRTPLAVLQTNLDLLSSIGESKNSLFKDVKNLIASSKNQIKNLAIIIEELSLLSMGKKLEEFREKINLKIIIQETMEELRILAEGKDINSKIKILDPDLELIGDEKMLRKLMRNLISNAIKYGKKKSEVKIILKRQKGKAEIQVINDGVGIPKEDLPYIFERFYRVDKGRSKSRGGRGLGLAICKWIVELHKGNIRVESKCRKGTTFKVSLPLKED
ncbi:sensor histidine kinase [Patescibacteria group bacterium]